MPVALGFIETDSFFGAVEASNVMAGISNVVLLGKEVLSPGSITIKIIGEKESVQAAINAGTEAVKNLGRTISSHIIAEPDEQVLSVLPEISSFYFLLKKNSRKKTKIHETEKPEAGTEKAKIGTETTEIETEKPKAKIKRQKTETENPKVDIIKPKLKEAKLKIEKAKSDAEKPKIKIVKPKAVKPGTGEPKIEKQQNKKLSNAKPVDEKSITEKPAIEKSVPVIEKPAEDLSPVIDISIKDKTGANLSGENPADRIVEEKITGAGEKKRTSYINETIERLRKEALGSNKLEKKKPVRKQASGLKKLEKIKPVDESKEKKEKNKVVIRPALESLNVHKLRNLARSTKNFPIQGREISKANRKKLLEYFKNLE